MSSRASSRGPSPRVAAAAASQPQKGASLGLPLTPSGVDDPDVFAWMFSNPELFPVRSYFPGMPSAEELALATPPLSPLDVKEEKGPQDMLFDRRVSLDEEEDDDDDDDDDSTDSNGGERRSVTPSVSASGRRGGGGRGSRASSSAAAASSSAMDTEDPRKKRLEKNREIARNCRKRKREKMKSLEDEVEKLQEWNRQLEDKLKRVPETEAREEVRKREIGEIAAMVSDQSHFSEPEMSKKLHQYKEVYSDYGRDRKQAITFHVEQLKALLLPNQVSKMTLWCLQQNDDFYDEQRNKATFGGGIWNMLTEELKLTEDQKRTLLSMRGEIRGQSKNVGECLRTLKELERKIHENVTSMGKQMAKIMSVTVPPQQARFLLWIEENQDSVKVLNNIWEQKEKQLAKIAKSRLENGTYIAHGGSSDSSSAT